MLLLQEYTQGENLITGHHKPLLLRCIMMPGCNVFIFRSGWAVHISFIIQEDIKLVPTLLNYDNKVYYALHKWCILQLWMPRKFLGSDSAYITLCFAIIIGYLALIAQYSFLNRSFPAFPCILHLFLKSRPYFQLQIGVTYRRISSRFHFPLIFLIWVAWPWPSDWAAVASTLAGLVGLNTFSFQFQTTLVFRSSLSTSSASRNAVIQYKSFSDFWSVSA